MPENHFLCNIMNSDCTPMYRSNSRSTIKLTRIFVQVLVLYSLCIPTRSWAQVSMRFQHVIKGMQVPRASTRSILPVAKFSNCPSRCERLADIATALNSGLAKSGYKQQAWFILEDRSPVIAVLTELESIDAQGQPRNSKRWSTSFSSPEVKSLTDIFKNALMGAPHGRYRSFLFVLTSPSRALSQSSEVSWEGLESLRDAVRSGNRVPVVGGLKNVRSADFRCYVYVYEFERSSASGKVGFIEESSITAEDHLRASKIWSSLGLGN